MTCTDTKVDINKKKMDVTKWSDKPHCWVTEREGREKVKKTLESYLYKLQGQGFCHRLPKDLHLCHSFLGFLFFFGWQKVWGTSGNFQLFLLVSFYFIIIIHEQMIPWDEPKTVSQMPERDMLWPVWMSETEQRTCYMEWVQQALGYVHHSALSMKLK